MLDSVVSPTVATFDNLPIQFTTTPRVPTQAISSCSAAQATPSSGSSNPDIQAYLYAHNSVRAQHGAVSLTWDDNLASKAQQWANNCQFEHSDDTLGHFGGLF